MSWYEEVAKEIVENIAPNASTGHESDCSCDDCRMLKVGRIENARQIIAKHDPNRWVPVTERVPERRMHVQFVHGDHVCQGELWVGKHWVPEDEACTESRPVTHWRPIVLPEVKE